MWIQKKPVSISSRQGEGLGSFSVLCPCPFLSHDYFIAFEVFFLSFAGAAFHLLAEISFDCH